MKAVDLLEYAAQGPDMQNMRARMREETRGFSLCLTAKARQPLRRQRRTLRNSGMNLNSLTKRFLKLFHVTDDFLQ